MVQYPDAALVRVLSAAIVAAPFFMAQSAQAQVAQVTNIRLDTGDRGPVLILETTSNEFPLVSQSSEGRSLFVDLDETTLQLTTGESAFQQDNPAPGIANLTVTALDEDTVRITITGTTDLPAVEVGQAGTIVALSLFPSAAARNVEDPDIVVIGSRRPTPRLETPASTTVISPERLVEDQPLLRTVNDALQTTPGIVVNRLGLVTANINLRGLTGERIGALVDGERLPNRQFGPPLGNIDPFRIERVEVLRGPASSIYGADAFGGIVNIITTTPRPDRPLTVRTNLFGGNISEVGGNLEVQGPNFVIGTSARSAGNANDGNGNPIPLGTSYQAYDLYASGRVDLSEADRLELRFDRFRQRDADLPGFATPANSPFQNVAARNVFQNRDRYSLAYLREGGETSTSIEIRTFYQRFEDQTNVDTLTTFPGFTIPGIPIPGGPPPTPIVVPGASIPGANYSRGLTEAYGFTAQGTTPIADAKLTYGFDFSEDVGNSITLLDVTAQALPGFPPRFGARTRQNLVGPVARRSFTGLFLQSSYNVNPELTLTGGLRFDSFDLSSNNGQQTDSNAITLNLGGIYRFNDNVAFRANFAQGFRPPSLLFLFGNQADGTFFAPTVGTVRSNPNLEPERANNFDIGLEFTANDFRGGITYFNNQIDNFQGYGAIPGTGSGFGPPAVVVQTVNKNVSIQGIELTAAYAFAPNWSVEGNLTYVDSEDSSGLPLSQLEVFPMTVLLRLRYDDGKFGGFLQSRIYGGQGSVLGFNNTVTQGSPSATVFDLGLSYRVNPTTQLYLSVENLFDSQYIFPTTIIPAPGIRGIFGVRADF